MSEMPFVSSEPNAWMRPYWAELHRQSSFFTNLAPELQCEQLARAIEVDHPTKAQETREWNPPTRRAFIAVLDQALKERHAATTTELWRMRKGLREVQCVAMHTVVGLDLRSADLMWDVRWSVVRGSTVTDYPASFEPFSGKPMHLGRIHPH